MKLALIPLLAAVSLFSQSSEPAGGPSDPPDQEQAADLNVNSRYTVESIVFSGHRQYRLSNTALAEMQRLVGEKVNTDALNRLASKICGELRAHDVSVKLARGGQPESVKVVLE